ncbi:MAG: tRNA (adenosine(37)-N6)-dimethylallyltransferase MiaA [bacterium]
MEHARKISLVVLLGPTASGKTEISLAWAQALGCEILSADSMQVYRYMDIGTAKPTREMRELVPHHLIDVADPDELYSAARFQREADLAIQDVHSRGKSVLVVAGTGLYLRALTRGLFSFTGRDLVLRKRLQEKAREKGVECLHETLRMVDPEASRRIHPHDLFRIIRALEVFYLSGIPISQHHSRHAMGRERYRILYLGLERERAELFKRIDRRVDEMAHQGLLEEVRSLLERGYSPDLPPMKALGYRHMIAHLEGLVSLEEALNKMKVDTRKFAKRQLTWFKAMDRVLWFGAKDQEIILEKARSFLAEQKT